MDTEENLKATIPRKSSEDFKKYHKFFINDKMQNKKLYKHKNNEICTAKYNIFTYFPKALVIQFFKILNFYFLVLACVQVTSISPLSPLTTAAFALVIFIAILREGIEDLSRHKYDKETNNSKVTVYRDGKWIQATSSSINIGELVLVSDKETFAADLVLLDSNLPEGICYVETATLDGESKLKQKISNKNTVGFLNPFLENFKLSGNFTCDPPNYDLYKLDGSMELSMSLPKTVQSERNVLNLNDSINVIIPIDSKQLLLKGAVLKQTEWIIGFVVYTGHNTKIILNSTKPKLKFTKIHRLMNKTILIVFLAQVCLCITCSVLNNYYYRSFVSKNPYLPKYQWSPGVDSLLVYLSWMVLLNTMIPISLIITLEIVRSFQGAFISFDVDMYSYVRQK